MTKEYIELNRKSPEGYSVEMYKEAGINKGLTVVGEFCGGNLGKVMAMECVHRLSIMTMINNIRINLE